MKMTDMSEYENYENETIITNNLGARVIGIISSKGGVGKTTITANIGASLAYNYQENVIMIDANTTSSSLGIHLGKYNYPHSLNDVLSGRANLSQAIYAHPSGALLIPASVGINEINVDPKKLRRIVKQLREHFDYIILDCAPTLGEEAEAGIESSDELIIIANPDWPALLEAKRSIEYIKRKKKKILGVIINKAKTMTPEMMDKISDTLEAPILGLVSDDEKFKESVEKRVPLIHSYPYSQPAEQMERIMEKITKEKYYSKKNVIGKVLSKIM